MPKPSSCGRAPNMRTTLITTEWLDAYETLSLGECARMIFADALARYRRLKGEEVVFISGADEHGLLESLGANANGLSPKDFVDERFVEMRLLLRRLGVSFDFFSRTSDPQHARFVSTFNQHLLNSGAASIKRLKAARCQSCEEALADRLSEERSLHSFSPAHWKRGDKEKDYGIILHPCQHDSASCAMCGGPCEALWSAHLYLSLGPIARALRRHVLDSYASHAELADPTLRMIDQTAGVALSEEAAWAIPLHGAPKLAERTLCRWVDSLLGAISTTALLEVEDRIWLRPACEKLFLPAAPRQVCLYAVLLPALLLSADSGYCLDGYQVITDGVSAPGGEACSMFGRTSIHLPKALALLPSDYWRFLVFEAKAKTACSHMSRGSASPGFWWDSLADAANSCLGMIDAFYASVAGSSPIPDVEAKGLAEVRTLMDANHPGPAFGLLLDAFSNVPPSDRPAFAAGALELLVCFLPETATRAALILEDLAPPPIFPQLPLSGSLLKRRYLQSIEAGCAAPRDPEPTNRPSDVLRASPGCPE